MDDIEYQLRFLLDSCMLSVESVQIKDSTKMEHLNFLRKYKGQKNVYAFVKKKTKEYVVAPLFGVPINKNETKHKLLYCQIAVGNSIFASEEYAFNCKPPKGYDSFIVANTGIGIEETIPEFKRSQSYSPYSYVIPENNRVFVMAEVEFTYDTELEKKYKNSDVCECCKNKPSTSFCFAERAAFCSDCDQVFHANMFSQRHSRYYFEEVGKKKFINCREHQSNVVDYFCKDCKVPICTKCRMFGSHSYGPSVSHKMISYIEACDYLKKMLVQENDSILTALSRSKSSIEAIEKEIVKFEQNVKEVRDCIDHEYRSAIGELTDLVKKRYQNINARYFESKYLEKMAAQAISYPKEVDPSVLVEKWKSIEELNRYIFESDLAPLKKESPITLKGELSVCLEKEAVTSPRMLSMSAEKNVPEKRK